jgi:hypothetical protein
VKRFFAAVLLFFCLSCVVQIPVPAQAKTESAFLFSTVCSGADGTITLQVNLTPGAAVAGFRLRVAYDDSVLSFTGAKESRQMESGTMHMNTKSNPICAVYVCNTGRGYAATLSGKIAEFSFQVRSDEASANETNLCACVDETCDYSGSDMGLNTYEVLPVSMEKPKKPANARLAALVPSVGQLQPAFQPDVTDYRLDVEASVRSVTFCADGKDGSKVLVNRKNLEAPGSETLIQITATSADGKQKLIYYVTVCRAEKEEPAEQPEKAKDSQSGRKKTTSAKAFRQSPRKSGPAAERALASVKAGRKGRSGTAQRIKSPKESADTTAQTMRMAETEGRNERQPTPLNVVKNEFPPYLVGMLAAGFCVMVGVLLCIRTSGREKKK